MKSNVFSKENLSQSKMYAFYNKHARILKLITPDTPIELFVGTGSTFRKLTYFLFTDKNVIIVDPNKFGKQTIVPYFSIRSCIITQGIIPKIVLGISGGLDIILDASYLTRPDALIICDFIESKIKSNTTNINISSIISNDSTNNSLADIEKLAELKDKGIITEEEFQKKKKQLLGI